MHETLNTFPPALITRFETIYGDTYNKLYNFIRLYIKEGEFIKDVLQECYIRLWEKLPEMQDDEKILPLLRTIAMNITIDWLRKKARDIQRAEFYYSQRNLVCHADDDLNLKEVLTEYTEQVNALPSPARQIYQLIQEDGLTYKEAAEQLRMNLHSIKYHFLKARQAIQTGLPESKWLFVIVFIKLHRVIL